MKSKELTRPENQPPIILLDYCIQSNMPLETWEFEPSIKFFAKYNPSPISLQSEGKAIPTVIYNSQKCRVMFQLEPSGHFYSYGTNIYYGRLHAENDTPVIKWNGEECYCWHSITEFTIPFLLGVTPSESANNKTNYMAELRESAKVDNRITQYSELTVDGRSQLQKLADDCKPVFFQDTNTEHITYPIRLHAAIWNKYGNILFDLFDLYNIELWSKYSQYLKECYDILGRSIGYKSEFNKIC